MWIRRRVLFAILGSALLAWPQAWASPQHTSPAASVLVVGDSLAAEYGLKRGSGWVAIIEQRIKASHAAHHIHNSSISGDTSSGGLSRLPALLKQYQPDIVIIELGANDALRGLSLEATRKNLSDMIVLAKQAHAQVLLLGMQIPPNYGRQYAEQFRRVFPDLASQHNTSLTPFLLEGMAMERSLFQPDGIHPNETAQPMLADNVWRQLEPMLQQL